MPHALRFFKCLKAVGFEDAHALTVASIIEDARFSGVPFNRERIADTLCDEGFSVPKAEAITDLVRNCFLTEKNNCWFDRKSLKFQMVRAGIAATAADQLLDTINGCVATRRTAEARAPINLPLRPGQVIMCDFTFLTIPEMQKERRAIVITSQRRHTGKRCVVVPVSMTEPRHESMPVVKFEPGSYPFFHQSSPVWAVCDHIYT